MEETHPIAEAIEDAAGEQLGVERWDRPAVFRDSAASATDAGLPYWLVLVLSGAIATLGLAMDSSAVVIGAMLVAPLLAPVVGLALSLAVGDGRLAVQTAAVVFGSTLAVILTAALLTTLLPFQTITLEISARTRPTTLDLAIAVFSGVVGAVVTVARGSRLSAAIPGVAISVALIPPLAVAGFGVGIGWNRELILGSMLLYGANFAGIVFSGMLVFLLVGMHRSDIVESARRWHQEGQPKGVAAWTDRLPWVRSLGVLHTPWARVGLVLAFLIALGFPLSESLRQIAREARVEGAVSEWQETLFDVEGRASVLSREVVYGPDRTQVYLRVATSEWFGPEARERFERAASAQAGEPVRLSLEQLPSRGEDPEQLAALLPGTEPLSSPRPPGPEETPLPQLLASARTRLERALDVIALPGAVDVVGIELATTVAGNASVRLAYTAPEPLVPQAEQMLRLQVVRALELPEATVQLTQISTAPRLLQAGGLDTLRLREVTDDLAAYEELEAEILVSPEISPEAARAVADWLEEKGIPASRYTVRERSGAGLRVRVHPRRTTPADTAVATRLTPPSSDPERTP